MTRNRSIGARGSKKVAKPTESAELLGTQWDPNLGIDLVLRCVRAGSASIRFWFGSRRPAVRIRPPRQETTSEVARQSAALCPGLGTRNCSGVCSEVPVEGFVAGGAGFLWARNGSRHCSLTPSCSRVWTMAPEQRISGQRPRTALREGRASVPRGRSGRTAPHRPRRQREGVRDFVTRRRDGARHASATRITRRGVSLDGGPRSASASALEPVTVLALARSTLLSLIERERAVADAVLRASGSLLRLSPAQPPISCSSILEGRVAKLLVGMAEHRGDRGDG